MATPQCCSSWWISRFPQSKPLTGAGLWLATGTASATENMSGFKKKVIHSKPETDPNIRNEAMPLQDYRSYYSYCTKKTSG